MKTSNPCKLSPVCRKTIHPKSSRLKCLIAVSLIVLLHSFALRESRADTVIVNFSVLYLSTVDLTVENNPAGLTLDHVNMTYDNYGSAADFANANSAGITGTTYGPLVFNFDAPATAMNFDFSVSGVPGPDPNALIASFSLAGTIVDTVTVAGTFGGGQINGSLAYSGGAGITFDQATMFYAIPDTAPPGYGFTTQNISYDSTVPEPSTLAHLGLVAGGVLLVRRLRDGSRSAIR